MTCTVGGPGLSLPVRVDRGCWHRLGSSDGQETKAASLSPNSPTVPRLWPLTGYARHMQTAGMIIYSAEKSLLVQQDTSLLLTTSLIPIQQRSERSGQRGSGVPGDLPAPRLPAQLPALRLNQAVPCQRHETFPRSLLRQQKGCTNLVLALRGCEQPQRDLCSPS